MPYLTFSTLPVSERGDYQELEPPEAEDGKGKDTSTKMPKALDQKKPTSTHGPILSQDPELMLPPHTEGGATGARQLQRRGEKERATNLQETAYKRLLDVYNEKVIHGSRTLDESYYQTTPDKDAKDDMAERNKDQVVTKWARSNRNGGEISWTILRVDQLWLWVIDPSKASQL